ncbi:Imm9 family immunity protein [Cohnella soli]|uniref:Imm9 family immunity protein n=1 Tax=Cohnella soli TaxID=425005 RepID=A0ABW0I1N5_9BACL
MQELPHIRALPSIQVIGLEQIVDMTSIMAQVKKRIEYISDTANLDDLGGWRLLISLVFNHGNVIGIGNDSRRDSFHDPVEALFDDYTDLQTCLTTNVLRGLDAAFERGVTVAGKRFKLTRTVKE